MPFRFLDRLIQSLLQILESVMQSVYFSVSPISYELLAMTWKENGIENCGEQGVL
jgi:hypothetical protein